MTRSKVNDMTHKALVTALAVGFLAFALSTLPVKAAQDKALQGYVETCKQCKDVPGYKDECGRVTGAADLCEGGPKRVCCTPVPATETRDLSEDYEKRRACYAKGPNFVHPTAPRRRQADL